MGAEIMAQKRMKGMSLSSFKTSPVPEAPAEQTPDVQPTPEPVQSKGKLKTSRKPKKKAEKLATLNIQVTRSQQRWLQDTAQDIRDNNELPVPGPERVYPVHLIQIAIELLKKQDINWSEVTDIKGLQDQLKL